MSSFKTSALFGRKRPNLIASDVAQYIQQQSNARLKRAVKERVPLDDLYFGDDCYPAWVDMCDGKAEESYHIQIQKRLLNLDASLFVDSCLREKLRDTCNAKLEEARLLGLGLADIRIGDGLLPEWDQSAVDMAIPLEVEPVKDDWEDSAERDALTFGAALVRNKAKAKAKSTAPEDNTAALFKDDSSTASSDTWDSSSFFYSDDKNEHGEAVDERYAMFSGGDPQPLPHRYSESDDEAPHILFDVEMLGGPDGTYNVDMEVYEAESDSDVDELPEAELAVDATAYEFFFPTTDAVDANLPGMDLECSLEGPFTEADYLSHAAEWGDGGFDLGSTEEEEEQDEEGEEAMMMDGENELDKDVMMEF
ncbi:uncharacterized protein TrAFT101_009221 [Trichoderma asperellum]|uniref:uncharacterized protein n=1 Tax=Trichoderma asperellum TaxID=101201 RepID=UPI00332E9773|nr:hypothetical protein TrAFT101_009221 [Trichoderma asperellum]